MRYAVGTFQLESNCFSPLKANREYFSRNGYLLFGEEIISYHTQTRNELSGFLDCARSRGVDVVPLCAAWAVPYGCVERPFFDSLKAEFVERYRDAGRVDGLYLSLHGSMVVDGVDDPEGDLIETMRSVKPEVPITVTLDFHGNVTTRIIEHADVVVGYNSFPHTNLYETGEKAARQSFDRHPDLKKLVRIFQKIPVVVPLERMTVVDDEAMARMVKTIEGLEKHDGIVAVSLFCVHCWLDIAEMGASIVGVAEKRAAEHCGRRIAEIAQKYWDDRHSYLDFRFSDPKSAVAEALAAEEAPVVLNEPSDNVGAGATGDSTFVLRALLEADADVPSLLTVIDSETVAQAIRIGVGKEGTFSVGGKINRVNDKPVRVKATVRTIFDGRYRYTGPVMTGVETSMGRTCVLQIKQHIFLQVTELPVFTIDPEHYHCVGLFPERMKIVLIKSQGSYKASYNRIARKVIYVDTPGLARSSILLLPYRKIDKKGIFPFNPKATFAPHPVVWGPREG